jgi:fucose permease
VTSNVADAPLLLAQYGLFGLTIGVQGIGWNDVKERIALSLGTFGLAYVITPLVGFALLLFGRGLWRPFSRRQRAVGALAVIAGALTLLATAWSLPVLVLSRLLSGLGFSLLDAAVHDTALDWEATTGGQLLSLLYATFSAGTILGALGAGSIMHAGWEAGAPVAVIIPICLLVAAATAACPYPPRRSQPVGGDDASRHLRMWNRPLLILAALCLAGVCAESLGGLWPPLDVRARGGSALASSLALAFFNTRLVGGRLLNGAILGRMGTRAALRLSSLSLASGAGLLAFDGVAVSVVAYGLVGLGVAGVFPTALSSVRRLPGAGDDATSSLVAIGYLGAVIAPALAGWLADAVGLRLALPLALAAITTVLAALSVIVPAHDEQRAG